jgi:hypothetical protein
MVTQPELPNPQKILEDFFKEICIHFGLILPEKTVAEIIEKAPKL